MLRDRKLPQDLYQAVLQSDPFLLCLLSAVQHPVLICTVHIKNGGIYYSRDSHKSTYYPNVFDTCKVVAERSLTISHQVVFKYSEKAQLVCPCEQIHLC